MADKVVHFLRGRKGRKSDAAKLVEIGRLIQQIEDEGLREYLGDAWRSASITFFASPFCLGSPE